MAVRSLRVLGAYLRGGDTRGRQRARNQLPCIALEPVAGVTPSALPAVRIYVGTQPGQFRAQRVLLWSIKRVRDPARRYLIVLMQDMAGFDRRLWLTGFTNYRFAIPELAGGRGRAIYNDVDQIYLADPARLFDTPMGDRGVLSIDDRDTSVMLIDCARMYELWNGHTARSTGNRTLERRMRAADLWGALDRRWNARDEAYEPAHSCLVHYTTIHTQPWRPFPRDYVYRRNPAAAIWHRMDADGAGFALFDAAHPSPEFAALRADSGPPPSPPDRSADYRRLLRQVGAASVYYCGYDSCDVLSGLADTCLALDSAPPETEKTQQPDPASHEVVLADGLARVPDLDMPWLLDRLFARSAKAVAISVETGIDPCQRTPDDPLWWYAQIAAASARYPTRHWRLVVGRRGRAPGRRVWRWSGGALLGHRGWVLAHYKTGHRSQAIGLADALGWPYEIKPVTRAPVGYAAGVLRGRVRAGRLALPGALRPPWPDVVIASGWLPAVLARWIAHASGGETRLILMGRRGGYTGETQDIAIVCRHFGVPWHPRQLRTLLPPSKIDRQQLARARQRWPGLYGERTRPYIALLVGGTSQQHELDAATAATLVATVRRQVAAIGGALAIVTSRRSPAASVAAMRRQAGADTLFEPWRPRSPRHNPYPGYLAQADILVVTGESEAMIAEAVATGKPVYIADLPVRGPSLRQWVADRVVARAAADRYNARGTRRPQQGLQYLCARLVERRLLLPRRDMPGLHRALVEQGVARILADRLEPFNPTAWHETQWLARRIRALLPAAGASASDRAAAPGAQQTRERLVGG